MSDVTWFVAMPFLASEDGAIPGQPQECLNANAAVLWAERMSRQECNVGAIAFSRSGDLSSGTFEEAKLIRKFGDVPNDLSTL